MVGLIVEEWFDEVTCMNQNHECSRLALRGARQGSGAGAAALSSALNNHQHHQRTLWTVLILRASGYGQLLRYLA